MSKWRHSFCLKCFSKLNPDKKPVKIINPRIETCCSCGKSHSSGIYARENPATLLCKGIHGEV